ncbi:hypothetical protein ABTK87_19960, partial [Acinetobacter baumannii]
YIHEEFREHLIDRLPIQTFAKSQFGGEFADKVDDLSAKPWILHKGKITYQIFTPVHHNVVDAMFKVDRIFSCMKIVMF